MSLISVPSPVTATSHTFISTLTLKFRMYSKLNEWRKVNKETLSYPTLGLKVDMPT